MTTASSEKATCRVINRITAAVCVTQFKLRLVDPTERGFATAKLHWSRRSCSDSAR
jgi:hypothetical protein